MRRDPGCEGTLDRKRDWDRLARGEITAAARLCKLSFQFQRGGDPKLIEADFVVVDTSGNLHAVATQRVI